MTKPFVKTPSGIVSSYNEAAEAFGVNRKAITEWKNDGGIDAGFLADGSVDLGKLHAWREARNEHRKGAARGIEAERDQKIRKLKLANDKFEGRLVERAFVAEKMQLAAGELNSFRAKSEAEHPLRFAAAAGDPAKCREVLRGVWDEIFASINGLSRHFAEGGK